MSLFPLARAALFKLDPEQAHGWTTSSLDSLAVVPGALGLLGRLLRPPARPTACLGLAFRNPVGLAAGFDKDATHIPALIALGFGFIEVGSVTARSSHGNPRPRLFRLPADRALINRMGLNNSGAESAANHLARAPRDVPIFVNIAKTHDTALSGDAAIADYVATARAVAAHADVVVLNISCPNSGDGRTFQDPELLAPLLDAVRATLPPAKPLLVKVSPDLTADGLAAVVDTALAHGADGFTATNTSNDRSGLRGDHSQIGPGGLSGAPLRERSRGVVAAIRAQVGPGVPIVGVGGISTGADAQAMLDAGANLVQLYTGFVYGGPTVVRDICKGLRK